MDGTYRRPGMYEQENKLLVTERTSVRKLRRIWKDNIKIKLKNTG
jgi:hypothetical protein